MVVLMAEAHETITAPAENEAPSSGKTCERLPSDLGTVHEASTPETAEPSSSASVVTGEDAIMATEALIGSIDGVVPTTRSGDPRPVSPEKATSLPPTFPVVAIQPSRPSSTTVTPGRG